MRRSIQTKVAHPGAIGSQKVASRNVNTEEQRSQAWQREAPDVGAAGPREESGQGHFACARRACQLGK